MITAKARYIKRFLYCLTLQITVLFTGIAVKLVIQRNYPNSINLDFPPVILSSVPSL